MSSTMIQESATIDGEQVRAITESRLDALLEGYELYGITIDDQMAINICDDIVQGMKQLTHNCNCPRFSSLPAGMDSQYPRLVEQAVGLSANLVKTKIDRRRLMAKSAGGSATGYNAQDENARMKPDTHAGPLVLISHSSKDVELATALIELLKAGIGLLADQIRCTSVDGYRLPVGVDTASKLREEVNAAAVVIGLITPSSLSSHYVMFELGARWGADLFVAPLLAGVEAGTFSSPLSLLNSLSANNEAQLHQLLADIGNELELRVQLPPSYLHNVSAVKALADAVPKSTSVASIPPAVREQLKVAISAEGTPPLQVLRVVANRPVEVSRVEYMLSSEATIASEDVSKRGGQVEIPINDGCFIKLWNTPRPDRNHYDHSGPAKMAVTISADGDTRQYILPVQMEATPRRIVGSKTFYNRD
jgi:hypothetical protein